MKKKYKIQMFAGNKEYTSIVYLSEIPGSVIVVGTTIKVTNHRNLSQLGTCSYHLELSGRNMFFGDDSDSAFGKWIFKVGTGNYGKIAYSTKLARFMRS